VGFALLAGATLAIGALSLRLLRHEETRLADEKRRTLEGRAQIIADDLQLAVRAAQDELLNRLAALPPGDLPRALAGWSEANPLVRNTFIWNQPTRRLEQPNPAAPTTTEEKSFIQRYSHLFTARLDTLLRVGERENAVALTQSSARVQLQQVAQQVYEPRPSRRGWIPWFEGDQLFLLGWVEQNGRVAGVELETAALLSRLLQVFPREAGTDRAWALLDGAGHVLHQTGGLDISKGQAPAVAVSLSPSLPHWQVAFFGAGTPAAAAGSYRLVSTLLVVALLLSILAGGTLLLLEAGRKAREARQKTSFVANVSHELKTPLTTLRMYAELLREDRVREPEKRQHYLDVMVTECSRLTRLVNNMLDFGRLEQQRRTYAVEPLELTAWLPAFLEAQRLRLEEAGLQLATHLPTELLTVRTDRDALEQAVLNLLDNALKYAADGKQIEIALTATTGGGAQFDVNDRGPGVPEALREKIFEKFYRLDQSLTARVPGSGLGLSIARRLLRDLGGDLVCLPREGGGACFRIILKGVT
jgi:signal transduction histidine kinase